MVGLLLAALSVAMVLYALQFARASWNFAQARPEYLLVRKGQLPGELALDALIRSLRESPYKSDLSGAAFVQLIRAQQMGVTSVRALPRLTAASRDLQIGIAAAPADAFAWTRLAVSQAELGDLKLAASALAMALQLAPAERVLAPIQFDLAVLLWDQLDASAKTALQQRLKWITGIPDLNNTSMGNSAQSLRLKLGGTSPR